MTSAGSKMSTLKGLGTAISLERGVHGGLTCVLYNIKKMQSL